MSCLETASFHLWLLIAVLVVKKFKFILKNKEDPFPDDCSRTQYSIEKPLVHVTFCGV